MAPAGTNKQREKYVQLPMQSNKLPVTSLWSYMIQCKLYHKFLITDRNTMYCNGNLVFSIAQSKQNPSVDTFQKKTKKQTNHSVS